MAFMEEEIPISRVNDDHGMSLQPGTVVAGKYEVVKCLGAGSMGLVYACRHRELQGHMIAIKVLFPEVAQDKVAAARFRNEIFASYGVSHPNVVRAYEYLRDGDLVAYTMEYVGGGDLADRISSSDNPLEIDKIVKYMSQMCLGVQAIHDGGIVHRDLKPENILLTENDDVKIADFGIARVGHGPKLTEHGGVVGTIDYVSPEYMLNSHVDWRSDIYALGILAYEMITGESPFRGDSVYATMTKRLKTDPKPPSQLRHECPQGVDQIVLKAMARDPEERYQSAKEMYDDIEAYKQGAPLLFAGKQKRPSGQLLSPGPTLDDAPSAEDNYPDTFIDDDGRPPSMVTEPSDDELRQSRRPRTGSSYGASGLPDYRNDDYAASDAYASQPAGAAMMQSVLGRDRAPSQRSQDVLISHGGLNSDRIKRLSQAVHKAERSIWVDVITWVIAVVFGVGLGFVFLQTFFPELIQPNRQYSSLQYSVPHFYDNRSCSSILEANVCIAARSKNKIFGDVS